MKDDLITYKTAKLAKEKDFDWETIYGYRTESIVSKEGDLVSSYHYYDYGDIEPLDWNNREFRHFPEGCCSAPTQSMLQRWLREVHKIDVAVYPVESIKANQAIEQDEYDYTYWIFKNGKKEIPLCSQVHNTFEETFEHALKRGLNLISIL